ncbi:MAG: SMC family ATPase [Hadesarchaea archaeon]|nr:SMC family ATPase [Hadesarchaea archaeon]
MITRVRLRNWKSHEKTELRFGDGTNVLIGIMGSGKSAVLDAITYALFGTIPAVQNRTIKLDDLIRNRPKPAESAEVEVSFTAPNGARYYVRRVIERGKGTTFSEIREEEGGRLLEGPHSSRVTELVCSLLKLDYDLFERAVYSEQNRLDYFLNLRRGERMRKTDELLGINKLELARKNMSTLINRIRDLTRDREQLIGELEQDEAIASLPILEQELEELRKSRMEDQKELNNVCRELESNKKELEKMQRLQEELARLDKTSRELRGELSALRSQAKEITGKLGAIAGRSLADIEREMENAQRNYENVAQEFDALSSELSARNSEISGLEAEIQMNQKRLNEISSDIQRARKSKKELDELKLPKLKKRLERLQTMQQNTQNEVIALRTKVEDLKQALEELRMAGSTCPVCESPLGDEKKRALLLQRERKLKEYQERILDLETRRTELDAELQRVTEVCKRADLLQVEAGKLEELELERSRVEETLRESRLRLENLRKVVGEIQLKVKDLRERVESERERVNNLRQKFTLRQDLDRVREEIDRKMAKHFRIQKDLWSMQEKYDEEEAKNLREKYDRLIRAQERLKTQISNKGTLITEKEKLIKSARSKKTALEKYRAESKYFKRAIGELQKMQVALARTQTSLRRHFIEAVNGTMSELWKEIYPYGDYVDIRLSVEGGERGGDYVLQLRDRAGNWVPVEGVTSGGERTCACLALRVAFAVVLAPALSWLVLDEPTHNLDADGIRELAVVLRERIPQIVQQLLLITHEERLEAAVSGYLYRFYRDKNKDEPTRIKQVTVAEVWETESARNTFNVNPSGH